MCSRYYIFTTWQTCDYLTFMKHMAIGNFISTLIVAVALSACASAPKSPAETHEFKLANKQDTPKPKSLPKRVLNSATTTTMRAAKGAADFTVDSAQMAVKATTMGVKAGGDVIAGTGKLMVKGTRGTVKGVGQGIDFIFTAPAVKDAASPVGNKTMIDAALSPLSDFNLRKRERPEVLMELEKENLYYVNDNANCEWLASSVAELDDALGADYDVKETTSSTLDKVGKAGKSVAMSEVASSVGSYVPGRGIVRSVSGAKAREKQTREIYQKGVARRSYLKGIAASQGCTNI